jgi:hypothetical protein
MGREFGCIEKNFWLHANCLNRDLPPAVTLMSATKSDEDRAITRSFEFHVLGNAGRYPTANLTTLVLQDAQQT